MYDVDGHGAEHGDTGRIWPPPWTVVDVVTVAFGCATVVLTGVAIGLGVLAWFAYRDIKASLLKIAETTARQVAEDVAGRQLGAYIDRNPEGGEGAVEAYREPGPGGGAST